MKIGLNASQLGVYIESVNNPASTLYNCPFLQKLKSIEDLPRLEAAIHAALAAHPGMWTILTQDENGEIYQEIGEKPGVERIVLSDEEFARRKENLVRPFQLLGHPLVRLELYITPTSAYFFFDMHHTVFDGTSFQIFYHAIGNAFHGDPVVAEEYTGLDFARDEKEEKERTCGKDADVFYDELLSGRDVDCAPAPDVISSEPKMGWFVREFTFDNQKLKDMRKTYGFSTTAFFTTVMGYVSAKFMGKEESVIGTIFNGRISPKLQNTVTMLVRTLPFVVDITKNPMPGELVSACGKNLDSSHKYCLYPYFDLVAKYGVSMDIGFAFQGKVTDFSMSDEYAEWTKRIYDDNHIINGKLLLELSVCGENSYSLQVGYRADIYSREFAESFARAYLAAANAFLNETPVCDICLADADDCARQNQFNATERSYDASLSAVDLFRSSARAHPSNLAVKYQSVEYTYAEFDRITDALSVYISGKGIGKDDFVAILIPRSEFMPITAWGVVKAGAAYQPLDPTYPKDRLNFMVKDSKARLLIADRNLRPVLDEYTGDVLYTDEILSLPEGNVLPSPSPDSALVILYTSGTTGLPKGCILEHRNFVSYMVTFREMMGLTSSSRVAAYASFGFDAGFMEIFTTLSEGASLYIMEESMRLDLAGMDEYYTKYGITNGFMTTQVGRMFVSMAQSPTLKYFMMGGEKLVPFVPQKRIHALNCYGPSETTVSVTRYEVQDDSPLQPIGYPNYNTKIYVVDKQMHQVPIGAVGELCVSGAQVSRGYLNRPEKTAEVFVANPFSDDPAYQRMYRTGDVVRLLGSGALDYVGRKDSQVKVRGFRIELTEVEHVIREYPGITDATVAAYDAPSGGKFIAAYIVSPKKIDIENLNAFILERKPSYIVPAVTMQIDAIPLTVNGKVDKRKLPVPRLSVSETVSPRNEMEQQISSLVSDILGVADIGITTDLYAAGLTSIGSMKLNTQLSNLFGVTMQMQTLKEHNTIEKLAVFLSGSKSMETFEIHADYPLTKTQEGIFVECMAHPDSLIYNIPVLLEIDPSLDVGKLKQAIADTVNAHSYIKTTLFIDDHGDIRQKRNDADVFSPQEIEECADPEPTVFELLNARLFRIAVSEGTKRRLFIDFHHIISDGTSLNIFLRDISRAYAGEVLRPESFTGFEKALAEQQIRSTCALSDAKEYYDQLLSEIESESMPEPDMIVPETGIGTVTAEISLVSEVTEYCQTHTISVNGFFLSVFGFVLAKFTGSPDSLFATVYNGRNDSRFAESMAMLVKTLPVYCSIAGKDVVSYASGISQQIFDSMVNDIYSYAEISRELSINPQVFFIYQGDNFVFDRFCDLPSSLIPIDLNVGKQPLIFQVSIQNNRFVVSCEYSRNLYSHEMACSLVDAFTVAVSKFIIETDLDTIGITSPDMLEKLAAFNATECPYDSSLSAVDLFRSSARAHPSNLAVKYQSVEYTYAEFDRITDALSAYISGKGIGKDDFVAILIPRSEFMPITAWGVVKAGAAYQPLDPTYPKDRLNFMVKDSKARLLIADRSLRPVLDEYTGDVLYTDEILSLPEGNVLPSPSPDSAIVILYTSGTTGLPKGCILEHLNFVSFMVTFRKLMGLTSSSRVAAYASFGFDAGFMEIFTTLSEGASLYIMEESLRLDLAGMDEYYTKYGITNGFMTTQVGRMFVSMAKCPTLNYFIMGGEKLVPFVPQKRIHAINGYGPSETTCCVTCYEVQDDSPLQPIGYPNYNTKIYVVDKQMHQVPIGAAGELCVSGAQVSRGYLNRPEKTAEVFVANPFSDDPAYQRMYRTGDVVRWLGSGALDYVGRKDSQVKVRGFRIELTEVEHVIREYPGITDATVAAYDDPSGGKFIAAYIVSPKKIDIENLNAFILERKPPYIVPAVTMQIDTIPLTVNGKVDKRKLPEPERQTRKAGKAPKNEIAAKLCTIYAKILGIDVVYADDDFFDLGGTSISSSKVALACANEHIPIVYKNIFDYHTPEKLAEFVLSNNRGTGTKKAESPVPSADSSALAGNRIAHLSHISHAPLGDVLLTGATGFLGIHVLKELLESEVSHIYCLVRKTRKQSADDRLTCMLYYYFGGLLDSALYAKITVIDSDILEPELKDIVSSYDFSTIINCAASVKHFVADDSLEKINAEGVHKLVEIALEKHARLIQTSTLSIAGDAVDDSIPPDVVLHEDMLYFGQSLENKYVHSKFRGEKYVLDAVEQKGLSGKVIRLGNLMSRMFDGEFQINAVTNNFMRQMRAYTKLGCFPVDMLDMPVEFSPIDKVASAVVLLAGTPDEFTVFHADNCHSVHMANIIECFNQNGLPIEIVSLDEFNARLQKAMADEATNVDISSLLSYQNNSGEHIRMIGHDDAFSVKALYRLGFSWPLTAQEYISSMIKGLKELNYFS